MKRRDFITQLAGFGVLAAWPRMVISQTQIGSGTLRTLSDGNLILPRSFLLGDLPSEEVDPILSDYGISGDMLNPPCNVTLYQDGTNTVLFDVGAGSDFQPTAGKLSESLEALGINAEDITHVVFTHAHPDHIWGLLDDFDELSFANASYMMGRDEWDYWWDPNTVDTIGQERVAFAVGAKRRMEAIEDQVEYFDADQEILPGILSVSTAGHTPGHMSFEVRQGGDAIMIIGDAITNHHMAFRHPEWPSGSDQDTERAAQTRVRLFDRLANEQIKISGFHLPEGGIGMIDTTKEGYVFEVSES